MLSRDSPSLSRLTVTAHSSLASWAGAQSSVTEWRGEGTDLAWHRDVICNTDCKSTVHTFSYQQTPTRDMKVSRRENNLTEVLSKYLVGGSDVLVLDNYCYLWLSSVLCDALLILLTEVANTSQGQIYPKYLDIHHHHQSVMSPQELSTPVLNLIGYNWPRPYHPHLV